MSVHKFTLKWIGIADLTHMTVYPLTGGDQFRTDHANRADTARPPIQMENQRFCVTRDGRTHRTWKRLDGFRVVPGRGILLTSGTLRPGPTACTGRWSPRRKRQTLHDLDRVSGEDHKMRVIFEEPCGSVVRFGLHDHIRRHAILDIGYSLWRSAFVFPRGCP